MAEQADRDTEELEIKFAGTREASLAALDALMAQRARGAADRALSALNRARAAADREASARDREMLQAQLREDEKEEEP